MEGLLTASTPNESENSRVSQSDIAPPLADEGELSPTAAINQSVKSSEEMACEVGLFDYGGAVTTDDRFFSAAPAEHNLAFEGATWSLALRLQREFSPGRTAIPRDRLAAKFPFPLRVNSERLTAPTGAHARSYRAASINRMETVMIITQTPARPSLAAENDQFRRHPGSDCMITAGVRDNGPIFVLAAVSAVRAFDAFISDNDPHGEHDFGGFELYGERLFWKIDYYDKGLSFGSPDPADPTVTRRLLTIMLASEY